MPKILTPAMRAHLDAETTQLAAIWRITRKDGAQFFFTDHPGRAPRPGSGGRARDPDYDQDFRVQRACARVNARPL
jgi:hypothetical protein